MKAILRFLWPIDQMGQRIAEQQIELVGLRDQVALLRKAENADQQIIEELQAALARSRSDEQTSAERLKAYRLEAVKLISEKEEAYRVAGLSVKETEAYRDAVKMLVERGDISAIEVAQLNLGRYVPGVKDEKGVEIIPPTIELEAPTHGKSAVDFGMKSQATEAKFRQVKQHFQQHQAAVSKILDGLNEIGRKNVITKEDIRRLRELRETVSNLIMRSI